MNEASHYAEQARPPVNLSRRLFLKGTGGLLLFRLAERVIHFAGAEQRTGELPVTWRFGYHALEESDGRYLLGHPSIILGETQTWNLDSMAPDATIRDQDPNSVVPASLQKLTRWFPATGIPDEALRMNHNVLVDARDHGSFLVATDWGFYTSVPGEYLAQEIKPMNTAKTAMLFATAGFVASELLVLRKITKQIGDAQRKGVPYESPLLKRVNNSIVELLSVPMVASLVEEALGRTVFRQYKSATNLGAEGIIKLFDILSGLLGEKGFILVDAIVRAADISMALNTRAVQEFLRQNPALRDRLSAGGPAPLGAYFFAGGAHVKAKDYYESRTGYLSGRLEKIADQLIDFYLQELAPVPERGEPRQDREGILHSWTFLTSRFGYPIPSFADLPEFQFAPKLDLPDSPRAILYKQLLRRIVKKDTGADQYWSLFQRLAQEDMRFNSVYERHVAPLRQRAMNHRTEAELTLPFGESDIVFFEGIPHWMPALS